MPDAGAPLPRPPISAVTFDDDQPPRVRWDVVVAAFAVATLLRFAYFYFDDLARQMQGTLLRRVLEEGTGNLASLLLFPIALYAERWWPLDRGRWRRTWPLHVAAYVVYSVAHTTVIASLRAVLFPALGQGPYDYGLMRMRYVMESAQDFFSYATFVGILALIRAQQSLRAKERRTAALERDAANARLEALSLRLQPHFLFNALNTIASTAYQDPVATDELIGRLGDLLRQSLRTTDRQELPLREEIALLDAYRAFVDARFGDRIHITVQVDPAAEECAVPAFLLQPLVENAVRHGTTLEFAVTNIHISARRAGGQLAIVIENDAPGAVYDPERLGTGLGTTRDRLALLYGSRAALDVDADGTVFRVSVRIPATRALPAELLAPASDDARAHR